MSERENQNQGQGGSQSDEVTQLRAQLKQQGEQHRAEVGRLQDQLKDARANARDARKEAKAASKNQGEDFSEVGAFPTIQQPEAPDAEPNAGLLELPFTPQEMAEDITAKAVAGDPAVSPNLDPPQESREPQGRRIWASNTTTTVGDRGQPDPATTDSVIYDGV